MGMRRAMGLVAAGSAVALAAVAGAGGATAHDTSQRVLKVNLRGAAEVPGPGDDDARGTFRWTFTDTQVCYLLTAEDVDGTVVASHIHRGTRDVAGPVVVPLAAPVTGASAACADVAPALLDEIQGNPKGFYVNVHSTVFPPGAIRGQLKKG